MWKQNEEAGKQLKQKDYMVEVKNAKRLIAKYAREEQQDWEDNLK